MQPNNCPDLRVWQSFLAEAMAPAERSAVESHLASCRLCRERLIALYDEAEEAHFEETAPSSLVRRVTKSPVAGHISLINSLRPYVPLALAATVLISVGLSFFVYRNIRSPSEKPSAGGIRRSNGATNELALVSPVSGAELNQGPAEFRWADAGEGARYEFTLTDEKGDIIVQEKLTTRSLAIDTTKLRLTPQRNYYWSVSARLPNGTTRESSIARFTLR